MVKNWKIPGNLQGQSPYLINVGINYGNEENGWQTGLFYNVQGETLEVVGTGDVPDVYTMPFNSLNFTLSKSFGKNLGSNINFGIKNILNDDIESHYQSYKAEDEVFSKLAPGRGFTLGYAYKF
ncbi:MAG: TonB-dependent receptor [Flavobacteriaceae bacterium]|nr:TonB-dependent receptor [Flavobacteriaceae bacterium]